MKWSSARASRACLLVATLAAPAAFAAEPAPPLTLRQAVDAAMASNPELQTFSFEFRALDARARQATLRPAPELSVTAENLLGSGETRGLDAAELTFALSQVIELGGKRDARIDAAKAGRSVADVERQARQLDVLAEVTRRFIGVATRQQQVQLAANAVKLAGETVSGSEKRVNAAKSPHAEFDRAKIALDRARLEQRQAEIQLDTARRQLAATWGESQAVIGGQAFGAVAADLFTLPEPGDYDALVSRLAQGPDFLRFASEARLRDAELRLAATARKPDVTIGAGVRRLESSDDQAFVASFSLPLFSARRSESLVAEAQASRDLVDAQQRIAMVKAKTMLYELYRELGSEVLEAQTLRNDILPRAEEALKETEYAYQRGRYSYLEWVDAQREYLALQADLIEASSKAQALRVEIERLTHAPLADAR
ncbi:TolC family protein [Hydrocarboniphaga sp.]|uniref:TolC family protein n=1 Tax=Hydrocarboniphaga sp. TaxID=2033016 RepID=UPI003D110D98